MADDSVLGTDLKLMFAQLARANVERLQKSMRSFGWRDPRFVSADQALANGWVVNPGAESVEVRFRNGETGVVESLSLVNAENVVGMPSLAEMLAMADAELLRMQGGAAAPGLLDGEEVGDDLVVGPARVQAVEVDVAGERAALTERFNHGESISENVNFLAIEENNRGLSAGVPVDGLALDMARATVFDDVAALGALSDVHERHFALVLMGHSADQQANYREELERQAPDVAVEAAAALGANFHAGVAGRSGALGADVPLVEAAPLAADVGGAAVDGAVDRFAVLAPYWLSGLHNAEGVALAAEINKAITAQKLAHDKEAIARLFAVHPKARQLGVEVVSEAKFLADQDLKWNLAEPKSLLGGALVRDKEGAYRPAAGGAAVLLDKGDAVILKGKGAEAYRGAMELARAKGWNAIELKGKPAMLASAWLEAQLMQPPMEVVNYSPTPKDKEKFAEALAKRVAEERAGQDQGHAMEQAPEMVEVRPFVDVNGQSKVVTVTYTVSFLGGKDAVFDNAKDAAKAFGGLSASAAPVVVRSVARADGEVRDCVVAGVDVRPNAGHRGKVLERMVDREFDAAMGEVIEEVNAAELVEREVASEGIYVGPIVAIEGALIGQKCGRDPNKLVWHDLSKLKGVMPKPGEMAEIGYSKGVGVIKDKERELELDDGGGLGR